MYTLQKKNPRIFPPRCFLLASSWSMMPPEVVRTTWRKQVNKRRSMSRSRSRSRSMSNLAELSGGQEVVGPLLDVSDLDVEPAGPR